MQKPDFIIIGETKCGTTSLYNYLIQHPKIIESYGNGEGYDSTYANKEIRFLDRFFHRGWSWYFSCFPETSNDELTGEATPMYMYRTLAASRLFKQLPSIKLIVLLRNPVDRLISNYHHNFRWVPNWADRYPTLNDYIDSCSDNDYYLVEKGLYYYSLLKWFEFFPNDSFCILSSEEMFSNAQKSCNHVFDFLGLDKFELIDKSAYRTAEYQDISESLRGKLINFYEPFNLKLEKLIGKTMNWNK